MTPPNEVPREAGRYMCRHSLNVSCNGNTLEGCPTIWIVYGTVSKDDEGKLVFKSNSLDGPMPEDQFASFDWHKIQLPEGWR